MPTPYEKEMKRLRKLLAETDEDPDFENEDSGPENVLEEIFLIMKVSANMIRNRKRTEIIEVKMRITWNSFHQKRALSGEKQNLGKIFVVIILYRSYLEQKDQQKM
ncbi:hypothetical protein AVEN_46033-1 [Araneus ventricosus]|uniref:Uncharacterized protein n=1 Tax=Araneus ventricosus TaxID=182803 RepID=A0A4Y2TZN7_ARAVE|nr:hypothetical protein AVEN_46033-1 [Araneus ventricosus]